MQSFGSGPNGSGMISGKWVNKRNGTTIYVRDAIMQGDDLVIMTDKGQISGADFSANYIQMSDEEYDLAGNVISSSQNSTQPKQSAKPVSQKPVQPQPQMFDSDALLRNDNPGAHPKQQHQNTQIDETTESEKLIKKLFSKIDSKPEISIDIQWADFPKNELSMLMSMFDVTKEDIASYMRAYLDKEAIETSIIRFLEKML